MKQILESLYSRVFKMSLHNEICKTQCYSALRIHIQCTKEQFQESLLWDWYFWIHHQRQEILLKYCLFTSCRETLNTLYKKSMSLQVSCELCRESVTVCGSCNFCLWRERSVFMIQVLLCIFCCWRGRQAFVTLYWSIISNLTIWPLELYWK